MKAGLPRELGSIPISTLSILLSILLAILLWRLDIANPGPAIVAGLMLELVLVTHRMFARVGSFGRLLGQISSLPDLSDIVAQVSDISRDNRRFPQLLLHTIVHNFCNQTAQLRHGRQNMSPDQFMIIARAVYGSLTANDNLVATSYFGGGDYWTTQYGSEYANLNRMAHSQGAKITRIYVLRDSKHLAEKDAVLRQQAQFSAIRVLLLDEAPLDASDHRDFLIVNDQFAAEFHFAGGVVISSIDIVLDQGIVDELSSLMRKLASLSKPFRAAPNC